MSASLKGHLGKLLGCAAALAPLALMVHLVLAATSEGVGSCWIVSFEEQTVKEQLKIPEGFSVVAIVSLGYPEDSRDYVGSILHFFRPKKGLSEIAFTEEFGRPLRGDAPK